MEQKAQESKWRRSFKVLSVFLVAVAALLLLIQILFTYWAEPYLKKQIQSAVAGKSLRAEIKNINISPLRQQLKVSGLKLSRDSAYSDSLKGSTLPIDSVTVANITLNGFQLFPYLLGNRLALDYIEIDKPRAYLVQPSLKNNSGQKTNLNAVILEQFKSYAESLEIDEFLINGLSGSIRKPASKNPFATIHNIHLTLSDIRIDSGWVRRYALLPTSDFHGSLDSLRWASSSKLYDFKLSALQFSSADSSLTTKTIAVIPRFPKYEFSQHVGHQIDRIDLDVSGTEWRKINLPALVEDQILNAAVFKIQKSRLGVFRSKIPPLPEHKRKKFPHVQLQELKYPVTIDSILVESADIFYSEHLENVPKPGTVSFKNTSAVIKNVSNTVDKAPHENPITMETSSEIMGAGRLDVFFRFPVTGTSAHSLNGRIGTMPIPSLNPVLKYLAKVEAPGGQIHSIDFQMDLTAEGSQGTLKAHYTGLQVNVIDFEGTEVDSKNIVSFLANNLVIEENNKPPLTGVKISYERDPHKSVFYYWWKSLLSGLKSSIGL